LPRLLLLDNHDSFTWNVSHALEELGASVVVVPSDVVPLEWVEAERFDAWVLSPGPGRPEDAGISLALARAAGALPLLGVCLGHQALGMAHGARVVPAARLMHGKTSEIHHDGRDLFRGLPEPFTATRYHSLALDPTSLGAELVVTARAEDGEIMAIRHREHPSFGVQFHPESIRTTAGRALFRNFLELVPSAR
jgi:anthranilate synthase/aminodeoxychorismate synthase-like glutamine amidotransferase